MGNKKFLKSTKGQIKQAGLNLIVVNYGQL